MNTPIQELLQQLKEVVTQSTCYDEIVSGVSLIVLNDNHWTDKEKEVIQRAYKQGVVDEYGDTIDLDTITEAEEYYNRTFNTKEKKNYKNPLYTDTISDSEMDKRNFITVDLADCKNWNECQKVMDLITNGSVKITTKKLKKVK